MKQQIMNKQIKQILTIVIAIQFLENTVRLHGAVIVNMQSVDKNVKLKNNQLVILEAS